MVEEIKSQIPMLASAFIGALLGMTVAWFTALQEKGVTRKDMEEYVKNYSPYVIDKAGIAEHQSNQDKEISRVVAIQQTVLARLEKLEARP